VTRAILLAGLRRFAVMAAVAVAATAGVSALVAVAGGQDVRRAITVGLYLVGAVCVMLGFFAGNRAPVRAADGGMPGIFGGLVSRGPARWATAQERDDQVSASALFVTLGLVLVAAGLLVDARHSVA
jgi:hypothetical protein